MKCSKCVYSNEVSENWQMQLAAAEWEWEKSFPLWSRGSVGQARRRLNTPKKCSKIRACSNPFAGAEIRIPMHACVVCVCVCVWHVCESCVKFNVSVTKWRAATMAPEFRDDNNGAQPAGLRFSIFHLPIFLVDLPLVLVPLPRSLRWPYKNVRFLFIWWNEIQFLNALRRCAARTSLQLQFLGAARDIDIFISQYICINSDCSETIKARTVPDRIARCRQLSTSECKLFNTYLNFVVCCIRKLIYSSIQSKWINIANKVSLDVHWRRPWKKPSATYPCLLTGAFGI